jgi:hypothetical protein
MAALFANAQERANPCLEEDLGTLDLCSWRTTPSAELTDRVTYDGKKTIELPGNASPETRVPLPTTGEASPWQRGGAARPNVLDQRALARREFFSLSPRAGLWPPPIVRAGRRRRPIFFADNH